MNAPRRQRTWKHWLSLAINVGLFAVAIAVLRHILTQYHFRDFVDSLDRIGVGYIAASVGLTILGYAALVGYDYLSLRVARHPIPLRRMWSASFVSHAVQNSAPMSIIAGGGVRYRLFERLGVSGAETAAVVAGNLITFVIGLFAVAGVSFVFAPIHIPASFHLPIKSLQPVGFLFLALVAAALLYSQFGTGVVRIRRRRFILPRASLLRSQLGVSVADWLLSSTALYVLIRAGGPVPYPEFLSGFLLAQIVTQVIPLPGGVGVFEAAILVLRPPEVGAPLATAALLVYRVVYYLIPLFVATGLLASAASRKDKRQLTPVARTARELAPRLFAILTFVAGVMLLVFTALPEPTPGLKWLGDVLRLAVIEGSHFLGSLVGMGLVLLAFGLERRLRSAFHVTIGLLLVGIPAALLQTGDLVSAVLLAVLLLLLLTARDEFDRRIPFGSESVHAGWVAAIVVVVLAIGWVGIYLQVHHEYTTSLWWRFALDGHAPRTLRIAVSVLIAVAVFVTARLISRARSHRSGEGPHDRRPKARGKKGTRG